MTILARLTAPIEAQRGALFAWSPVCLGTGIGLYFALPVEPAPLVLVALAVVGLAFGVLGLRRGDGPGVLMLAAALVSGGVALGGARSLIVAAPVLGWHYYGPIEGRVLKVDRSQSDAVRLTLDQVRLAKVAPERTPERVRVSLHGRQGFIAPEPGMRVAMTGHLDGPGGPVEPGGFDFRRHAWFERIGAVGYSRKPALRLEPLAPPGFAVRLAQVRHRMGQWFRDQIPGEAGAFAAAITTGSRADLPPGALTDLRRSNLAHLLAISGLHMGMLAAFVYAALRAGLALLPALALRFPIHKIAALGALAAATLYLGISGASVATQRAWVMVAVMLIAIMLDQRALTLRSVAWAALIVLFLRPEALTGPGFQMSFAATTALIAAFAFLAARRWPRLPRPLRPVAGLVTASAVAGAATAPFAAAHFNQIASYGLLANLLAVPAMGLVVMPAAVLTALLGPLGLGGLGVALMKLGIDWILLVAHRIAGLDGAVSQVPTPPGWVLPVIALAGLVLVLWRGRGRLAAPVLAGVALAGWMGAERPMVLISENGRLVGIQTAEGRALNSGRSQRFAARVWLENDGDAASQRAAANRPGWSGQAGMRQARLYEAPIIQLSGRKAAGRVAEACINGALVVTTVTARAPPEGDCLLLDKEALGQTGAVAARRSAGAWQLQTAHARAGHRPWSGLDEGDKGRPGFLARLGVAGPAAANPAKVQGLATGAEMRGSSGPDGRQAGRRAHGDRARCARDDGRQTGACDAGLAPAVLERGRAARSGERGRAGQMAQPARSWPGARQ